MGEQPSEANQGLEVEKPYLLKTIVKVVKKYNPKYGDDRICKCGHPYYRHFDTYENMRPTGCKYCPCWEFEENESTKV